MDRNISDDLDYYINNSRGSRTRAESHLAMTRFRIHVREISHSFVSLQCMGSS